MVVALTFCTGSLRRDSHLRYQHLGGLGAGNSRSPGLGLGVEMSVPPLAIFTGLFVP